MTHALIREAFKNGQFTYLGGEYVFCMRPDDARAAKEALAALDALTTQGWRTAKKNAPKIDIERIAALLWKRDYPMGGGLYKTFESTPFHDQEIYRHEAIELVYGKEGLAKHKNRSL